MTVVVPIIYDEYNKFLSNNRIVWLACALLMGTILVTSFVGILQNWNKAYTDQIDKIWVDNKGWEDVTFLYGGVSYYGISFYAGGNNNCPDNYLDKVTSSVDNDNLLDQFWIWANDWDTDG